MNIIEKVKMKFGRIEGHLNERTKRLFAATEAIALGRGGIKIVAEATGMSHTRIMRGIKELKEKDSPTLPSNVVRRVGGGRKALLQKNAHLEKDLLELLESSTRGDPESPLRWCSKSTYKLAAELRKKGYAISAGTIGKILKQMGYSLQANKKTLEGGNSLDRNAQFEHINEKAKEYLKAENPIISVDTKKKELIGNYKNPGRDYAPKGQPREVNTYDFEKDLMRVSPYGVYDITRNEGWVSVGISNDTSAFAVESIRRWWNSLGKDRYPNAKKLMVTADGGGSNGSRVRLFKVELQKLANDLNMDISVCHFPPGTSKWNKIEHRMFSFISQNWRAQPLLDLVTVVNLIGSTKTTKGLKILCEIDENIYQKGIKVSKKEIDQLNIKRDEFHGEWNYTISPQK